MALSLLVLAPVAVVAQNATDGVNVGEGIIGIVIAAVATLLTAFGIGKATVGSAMKKLHVDYVDFDKVDKSVEAMLDRWGVPDTLADYIGDIVAQLATRGPSLLSKPFLQTVKEIFLDEFSRRSAIEAANLLADPVDPALVDSRSARSRVAEKLVSDERFDAIIRNVSTKLDVPV
jgi:hypothetical protein